MNPTYKLCDAIAHLSVDAALRVDEGYAVHPGLAGEEAEHGDEGPVEGAELVRGEVREERDAHDGVCEKSIKNISDYMQSLGQVRCAGVASSEQDDFGMVIGLFPRYP